MQGGPTRQLLQLPGERLKALERLSWVGSRRRQGRGARRRLAGCEGREERRSPHLASSLAQVEFHTSNLRGAGTDAVVYFQLFGDGGESETQRIVSAQEAFERGGVDGYSFR